MKNPLKIFFTSIVAAGLTFAIVSEVRRVLGPPKPAWSWRHVWSPNPAALRQSVAVVNLNQLLPELSHLWKLNEQQVLPGRGILAQCNKYYKKVIEYYPQLGEAHTLSGFCYYYREDTDQALGQFKTTLKLMPQSFWPYYNLGVIYLRQEQRKEAAMFFAHALAIKPEITLRAMLSSKLYQQILLTHNVSTEELSQRILAARVDCQKILAALQASTVIPADLIKSVRVRIF